MARTNNTPTNKAASKPRGPKKPAVSQETFIRSCVENDFDQAAVATGLGLTKGAVVSRANKMRAAGVALPAFKSQTNSRLNESRVGQLNSLLEDLGVASSEATTGEE